MNAVLDILKCSRALLSDRERFTTGAWARNKSRAKVPPDDPSACCWCADGAMRRACGADQELLEAARALLYRGLHRIMGNHYGTIAGFNDRRGHAGVLQAFDYAIGFAQHKEIRKCLS